MANKEPAFDPRSESFTLDFLESVLDLSQAKQTEILLEAGKSALTRFARNQIHQNMSSQDMRLSVRIIEGQGIGFAATNRFDRNSLEQALEWARQVARSGRIPAQPSELPGPQQYAEIKNFFDQTAAFSPADRAQLAQQLIEKSSAKNAEAAGAVSNSFDTIAIVNSRDLRAFHSLTTADFTATVSAGGATGWCDCTGADVNALDVKERSERALERALASRNPRKIEPGPYTVILEEAAVKEFLDFLAWLGFGAQSFEEGRSFMCGKIGQKITGANITIADDAFDPLGMGVPFDYEGMPKQRVILIENGVARGVVHDRASAARMGAASTGHALPPGFTYGPLPLNMVMNGGKHTFEQMLQSVERGLLVTRFWYCRVVDPAETLLTGQTRDGTFLIENGKLVSAVNDMRFNQSVLEAFAHAEMISTSLRRVESTLAPIMKIDGFRFTERVGE